MIKYIYNKSQWISISCTHCFISCYHCRNWYLFLQENGAKFGWKGGKKINLLRRLWVGLVTQAFHSILMWIKIWNVRKDVSSFFLPDFFKKWNLIFEEIVSVLFSTLKHFVFWQCWNFLNWHSFFLVTFWVNLPAMVTPLWPWNYFLSSHGLPSLLQYFY